MAEDAATGTLFLVVLDGHGEAGDKVAQVCDNGFQRLLNGCFNGFFGS
jgi:serine/threonine protein phosphatase PrpC